MSFVFIAESVIVLSLENRAGTLPRTPGVPTAYIERPRSGAVFGFMGKRKTLYAYARFALFLAHEFRWPAIIFTLLVLVGGFWLDVTYHDTADHELSYNEACWAVYCLIFFEPAVPFPKEWYNQVFFFIIPIIGLGAVADSVVRLAYFIFTAKQKLQEWHVMNASQKRNHIIVCGAGKVGYRIILDLMAMKEDVVAIERKREGPLVEELLDKGVTIVHGECRLRKTLEEANVAHAKSIILVTDDDLANIDSALTAREVKADIRVVLRLFDDTMATKVASAFKMPAISPSSCAASAFIAAATERNVFQSLQMGGLELQLADLVVNRRGRLVGRAVGDIQKECGINIVMHMSNGRTDVNPGHASLFQADDHILFISPVESLAKVEALNR
jgi:Trk K+ transport system NAD-binding subunit